ncbi:MULTISPECIES: hypothetical protein [unclassified Polynucleobacter]|jgi:hypothetical protein|uniref:hypothetical protein n=1 Tax=unclassified Polynucleobacter TaxID=2640945 RepID=UPI000BD10702|nr:MULTISPECIES: hypothetical protein [unclassified Polynucleobacter]OYY20910.1 MAG: hypothetical protein B7Y67_03790 [Polynucleobacter sp. 35-46-11]OZA77853.1 MAG: hypothetical protein B7X71_03390 [Polynucleobacter sp. 39-46-10]
MSDNQMLPPLINEPLYLQIQRLKEEVEKSNLKSASVKPKTPPIYTLEEKLVQWIQSLTPAQLERPHTTTEVIKLASLTGKYRTRPALQEVAQLLRKHGFKHKRSWTNASRNQRYWKFIGTEK